MTKRLRRANWMAPWQLVHVHANPEQIVFVALAQDEATYRHLANLPEQHQFYLKFDEVFAAMPTWEDVELAWGLRE